MNIREYAKSVRHEIVGTLKRRRDWESDKNVRAYQDDAMNEYYISSNGVAIVTADGGVL